MSGKRKRDEDLVEGNVNVALGGALQEFADSEEGPPGEPQVPHTGVAPVTVPNPDYLRQFTPKKTRAPIEELYVKVRKVMEATGSYAEEGRELKTEETEILTWLVIDDTLNGLWARFPSLGVERVRVAGAKYLGCSDETSARGASKELSFALMFYLEKPLRSILSNFRNVHRVLKTMAGFANETKAKSKTDDNAPSPEQMQEMMRGVPIDSVDSAQVEAEEHLNKFTDTIVTEEDNGELKAFASFWNRMMTEAELVGDPQPNDIADTVSHILDWSEGGATCILPTHSAREKAAFQPIIASLLRALSLIGNSSNRITENSEQGVTALPAPRAAADAASEDDDGEDEAADETHASEQQVLVRSDCRQERYIPPLVGQGTRHFADFEINEVMAFNPYLLPHETSVLVEAKNIMRLGKTAKETHKEAVNQCTGHLAKRTLVALNMGGVGVDLKSIGLIITPVYVEVITMTLLFATEPATEPNKHVDLTVTRSGILPLVSKAALEKFVPEDERTYIEQATSCTCVFPSDDKSIPTGMWMLWKLVCQDDNALGLRFFGGSSSSTKATYQTEHFLFMEGSQPLPPPQGRELGDVLGYGTHGIVYSVKGDTSLVVKSSVVGDGHIERELEALRALQGRDRHSSIPVLHDYGRTRYNIRGTTVDVPAFMFSPRGRSVDQTLVGLNREQLQALLVDILSALEFAHGKGVFHLDVCGRNIIFYSHTDGSMGKYVLIDWSCSVCGRGEKATGFRGSPAFAHRAVHKKKKKESWLPSSDYDVASLCFTICALDKGVSVPWRGLDARWPDEACFADRRQQTTESLKSLDLNGKRQRSGSFVGKLLEMLKDA